MEGRLLQTCGCWEGDRKKMGGAIIFKGKNLKFQKCIFNLKGIQWILSEAK